MTEPGIATPAATHTDETPSESWRIRLELDAADLDADEEVDEEAAAATGVSLTLLMLSLLGLAGLMWWAQASIARNAVDPVATIDTAAATLPHVIVASILAGVAAGVAAGIRFAAGPGTPLTRRAAVALGAGLVIGVIAGGLIVVAYGSASAVVVLGLTVATAAVIGGALAIIRPIVPISAGVAGTLGVLGVFAAFSAANDPLQKLFGAGSTVSSQLVAQKYFTITQSVAGGLVAGLVAYAYLRRRPGARGRALRWPWFLLAGATPGILLLAAELITRVGGARLFGLVSQLSDLGSFGVNYLGGGRLNSALVVAFLGGIIAMVAIGRTMRPAADADPGGAQEPSTS